MSKIIKRHNKKVLSKTHDQTPKCNCREKAECQIEGNCQVIDVVYKCNVTRPLPKKRRLADTEWKSRFYNHKLLFKHKIYSNNASYMRHLKSVSSETPNLNWSIWRCIPLFSNTFCSYMKNWK